jgi:hypothetical protein
MSTPSSLQRQVSQLIIPPFDDVFRRLPVPSMMIAATMLVLIINHAEVPFLDFSHFEPPLSVGLNEFIVTLVTAMVWTVAVALYAAPAAGRGRPGACPRKVQPVPQPAAPELAGFAVAEVDHAVMERRDLVEAVHQLAIQHVLVQLADQARCHPRRFGWPKDQV